jgi:hypothetical protein
MRAHACGLRATRHHLRAHAIHLRGSVSASSWFLELCLDSAQRIDRRRARLIASDLPLGSGDYSPVRIGSPTVSKSYPRNLRSRLLGIRSVIRTSLLHGGQNLQSRLTTPADVNRTFLRTWGDVPAQNRGRGRCSTIRVDRLDAAGLLHNAMRGARGTAPALPGHGRITHITASELAGRHDV